MAKKRTEERRIEEAIERGKRNADLMPKIEAWCANLKVEMVAAGLLAEAYQLPIGRLRISCPHALDGGIGAHDLSAVAAYFVTQNCRGCSHHKELSPNNAGRDILAKADEMVRQHSQAESSIDRSKTQLRDMVRGDLSLALALEPTTQQSILELVVLLDDEERHEEAAKKLALAAEVAPELFTPLAREIIASHFSSLEHGPDCIACLRAIGRQEGKPVPVAVVAAEKCLLERGFGDEACWVVADNIAATGEIPRRQVVHAIAASQYYYRSIFASRPPPKYPGSAAALVRIAKRNPGLMIGILRERLRINDKKIRVNTAILVRKLVHLVRPLALEMVVPLIEALELDDDHYEHSADSETCQTLAEIYRVYPEETQRRMTDACRYVSSEAIEILFDVHRLVVIGVFKHLRRPWKPKAQRQKATLSSQDAVCLSVLVSALTDALHSRTLTPEARKQAVEALSSLASDAPRLLGGNLDSFFGALATLALEEKEASEQKAEPGSLEELHRLSETHELATVSANLVKLIEELCEEMPLEIFTRVQQIVSQLSSTENHQEVLKARLISLYGELGGIDATATSVIPELYRALMDFTSVKVRGAAIETVTEILRYTAHLIPENMREMLVLFLNDPYKYIHQAVVHAVEYIQPESEEHAIEIVRRLLVVYHAYEKEDPFFCLEVVRCLARICRTYPKLIVRFAVPIILHLANDKEEMVADDALEELERLMRGVPEIASVFVAEVIRFLRRSHRDRLNQDHHSSRHRLFFCLFDQDAQAIAENLVEINKAAIAHATDDPWESLRLISLLLHFEFYDQAAETAHAVSEAQSKTRAFEHSVVAATILGGIAHAEAKVCGKRADVGCRVLREIAPLLEGKNENTNGSRAGTVVSALSLAHEIAERLHRI